MSIYSQQQLNDGVVTGFLNDKIVAWHQAGIDANELRRLGRAFDGPVPAEVAERLCGWEPVIIRPGHIAGPGAHDLEPLRTFELPDRWSQFVAHPHTGRVVNVAGKDYRADLHIVMRSAIEAALDAGALIASAVCLGDGDHIGMSFRAADGVVIGGEWGGATPLVGFNSSLTSRLATQIDTGTTLRVCDNTMAIAASTARRSLRIKRTRFAANRVTPAAIREALDIAFEDTVELVAELERLANIEVTAAQTAKVLDLWKPTSTDPADTRATLKRANAVKAHGEFMSLLNGSRNPFGHTAAGLVQAFNTYQHWTAPAKGLASAADRLGRQAVRTARSEVAEADAEFARILVAAGITV